jgi:hypothetical protein
MARTAITDTLIETGAAVTALAGHITDPSTPGLGAWDVRGLAGHLLRALRTPITYLAGDPAPRVEIRDAAGYFTAYLDRRHDDPAQTDSAVAERGTAELADADTGAIQSAFSIAVSDLDAAVDAAPSGFIIAGPFGGIELDAYLETRIFEATVHGLDLAHAISLPAWRPPAAALRRSVAILLEVALRRDDAARLLGVMTGRSWAEPGAILR